MIQPTRRQWIADAAQAGHPARMDFARLSMPVLLISVEDDRFGTAATTRRIAAVVPQAEMLILPTGGPIWLGHDEQVADRIHEFVRRHRTTSSAAIPPQQ